MFSKFQVWLSNNLLHTSTISRFVFKWFFILIFIRFGEFDITSHQKHEIVLRDLKHRIENYEQNNKIYVHLLHFKNTTPHSDNPTFELLYPKLNDIKNMIKNEINQ